MPLQDFYFAINPDITNFLLQHLLFQFVKYLVVMGEYKKFDMAIKQCLDELLSSPSLAFSSHSVGLKKRLMLLIHALQHILLDVFVV
jgi:hypothetical protein